MSLDGMRGTINGRATTAAPSSVDVNRPEAHGSYTDVWYSLYETLVVCKDIGPTGASGRELRHAE
jgi:hypothetical protein